MPRNPTFNKTIITSVNILQLAGFFFCGDKCFRVFNKSLL